MKQKCIQAVQEAATAIGRERLSDAALRSIDERLQSTMRQLARTDPEWQTYPRDLRVSLAAERAIEDLQAEASLKELRAGLQVLKTAETDARIKEAMELNDLTRSQGLIRDIEQTIQYTDAVRNEAISGLGDLLEAANDRTGTSTLRNLGMRIFDLDNPQMTADVVREVFANADGSTGNAAARAGAQAWLDTIERLRVRFNASGGNVGKLAYGYLAQAHDGARVLDEGASSWARKVLPLLDRTQYVLEDGSRMNDRDVLQLLEQAHETIATGGDNKRAPGAYAGTGARANRGSDHRALHFRDGDAWMAYMEEFGQGSLYDSMMGHIGRMARDVSLVERYGPSPEQQFRVQSDLAKRADTARGIEGVMDRRAFGNTPQAYWNLASGATDTAPDQFIQGIGQNLRNIQTAAKLGGAVLSSTTDIGTIAASLHYNRLPYFEMLRNIGRQMTEDQRDFLRAHGVIGESLVSTLNRWTGDNMTHSLTGRVAGSVMRLSLMNAWTDGLRGAFSATMMGGLARTSRKAWSELDEWDRYLLQRKGITEEDWAIVNRATPTEHNGGQYLTYDSVQAVDDPNAQAVASKILAFTLDEAQFAVVNPDAATRALITGGGQAAGTVGGEIARTVGQFKSFPTAMLTRHWRRIMETPQGLEGAPLGFGASTKAGAYANRIAGLAALNVTLMMLGAVVLQNKALVQGKDPFDMTDERFWMRAAAQGGGMGYLGDFVFKDPTEQRGNTAEQAVGTILGPVAGTVAGAVGDLVVANAWEAAKGEDTKLVAESLRWANSQMPYQSLWWARGMWEHAVLHNMQEAANPGYLSRMKARSQRDWGQGYWWEPGQVLPDRAPSFEDIAGR